MSSSPDLSPGDIDTSRRLKLIKAAALPTSEAAIYTVPANTAVDIKSASVTNTTGGALTVTLSLVPKAGTAGAANRVYSALSVAAGATTVLSALVGAAIADSDFVSAVASGAGVSIVMSGTVYGD